MLCPFEDPSGLQRCRKPRSNTSAFPILPEIVRFGNGRRLNITTGRSNPTSRSSVAPGLRLESGNLPPERAELLEPHRRVAQKGSDAEHRAGTVAHGQNGEFDRDAASVLTHRRHCEHIALTVPALAASHHPVIALPMTVTKALWHDQIEALAKGFGSLIAKNPG